MIPHTKVIYSTDDFNNDTLYSDPLDHYLDSDFYPISLVLETKNYFGVIYERLFYISGIPSSEKFFCTFTKNGKFISRILIASFTFNGTGMGFSGGRVPVFTKEQGCVDKSLTVRFYSGGYENKPLKYKIHEDGKLTLIK